MMMVWLTIEMMMMIMMILVLYCGFNVIGTIYAFVLMPIALNTTHVVLYFRVMAPIASILVR